MSNRVSICPAEFKDVRTGVTYFGVRIFDDACTTYDNSWDDIPEDDMEVLRRVVADPDEQTSDLLDYVREFEKGIYIGDSWYDYGDIKEILNDQEELAGGDDPDPGSGGDSD